MFCLKSLCRVSPGMFERGGAPEGVGGLGVLPQEFQILMLKMAYFN